jgi:hypothetical protein
VKKFIFETESPSFISGWFIDQKICDGIIDFYNEDNYFPVSSGMYSSKQNNNQKESLDKSISPITKDQRILNYFDSLAEVVKLYTKEYIWCEITESWSIIEHANIQHYPPNGGFKIFHTERSGRLASMNRHLVFMTYLNDVNDGGETEFFYQKLKVKPQKGLTLIWPTDWTHTHRGIPSPTQEKTIITGWYSFN